MEDLTVREGLYCTPLDARNINPMAKRISSYVTSTTSKHNNWIHHIYRPSYYEEMIKINRKKEEARVRVIVKEPVIGRHVAYVKTREDLLPERILTTISAIKGRLMLEVAPIHIKEFQCNMTPDVRQNIIQAGKRLRMYGKKMPIIARFDEYGNQLPEQIEMDNAPGVNIKILNPRDVGSLYFELVAIEFPSDYSSLRQGFQGFYE